MRIAELFLIPPSLRLSIFLRVFQARMRLKLSWNFKTKFWWKKDFWCCWCWNWTSSLRQTWNLKLISIYVVVRAIESYEWTTARIIVMTFVPKCFEIYQWTLSHSTCSLRRCSHSWIVWMKFIEFQFSFLFTKYFPFSQEIFFLFETMKKIFKFALCIIYGGTLFLWRFVKFSSPGCI